MVMQLWAFVFELIGGMWADRRGGPAFPVGVAAAGFGLALPVLLYGLFDARTPLLSWSSYLLAAGPLAALLGLYIGPITWWMALQVGCMWFASGSASKSTARPPCFFDCLTMCCVLLAATYCRHPEHLNGAGLQRRYHYWWLHPGRLHAHRKQRCAATIAVCHARSQGLLLRVDATWLYRRACVDRDRQPCLRGEHGCGVGDVAVHSSTRQCTEGVHGSVAGGAIDRLEAVRVHAQSLTKRGKCRRASSAPPITHHVASSWQSLLGPDHVDFTAKNNRTKHWNISNLTTSNKN